MPDATLAYDTNPKEQKQRVSRGLRRAEAMLALVWPYARPYKRLFLTGAVLSTAAIALRAVQPWPLKWIVDSLTGSPYSKFLPAPNVDSQVEIAVLAGTYVAVSFMAALADYGQLMTLTGLGNRVLFAFRAALYDRILEQSLSFHEKREAGELLTRVIYDTARLRQGINNILTRICQTTLTFLVTLVVLMWLDMRLTAIVAVTGILAVATMGHSRQRIFRVARKQREREGRLAALVAERLLGIRELHTFRRRTEEEPAFDRHNLKSLKQEQKVRRLSAGLLVRVELLLALCTSLILWLGAREVREGRLTAGDLVLFVSYVFALYKPFSQFARQSARSGKTLACADRLRNIMQKEPAVADLPGAIIAPTFQGRITCDQVSVKNRRRTSRKWTLEDFSVRIEPGERVALYGHNGAGKSTFLRLVLRLLDPERGSVQVDGRDVKDYSLDSLRRQISVVFQDSVFFGLTIRENIAIGRPDASLTEVQDAVQASRLHELIERLPDGYDTQIQQQGRLFSVGERQRIAIARALLRDGRIWLLDEPTNGLDAAVAQELVDLLLKVTEKRTVLWVTHDVRILPAFDRVVILREGRLCFSGAPQECHDWLRIDATDGATSVDREVSRANDR